MSSLERDERTSWQRLRDDVRDAASVIGRLYRQARPIGFIDRALAHAAQCDLDRALEDAQEQASEAALAGNPAARRLHRAHGAEADPMIDLVRYTIGTTRIDGPALPGGQEVALRILGTVVLDRIDDGMGGPATELRGIRIRDWAGPWVERHNPEQDPVDAALRVLAEYVRLPYGHGEDPRLTARRREEQLDDMRNREMMRRVLGAADDAKGRAS